MMFQITRKLQDYIKLYDIKKQKEVEEKERRELMQEIKECIQNRNFYQRSIDMVDEDELIIYFIYLIKAEESKLTYLRKMYKAG